jgi:hypothetical protein
VTGTVLAAHFVGFGSLHSIPEMLLLCAAGENVFKILRWMA